MTRTFQNFYCSDCHHSHPFERIADVWVSREQGCGKIILVRGSSL